MRARMVVGRRLGGSKRGRWVDLRRERCGRAERGGECGWGGVAGCAYFPDKEGGSGLVCARGCEGRAGGVVHEGRDDGRVIAGAYSLGGALQPVSIAAVQASRS